jgi:hypothetical protein
MHDDRGVSTQLKCDFLLAGFFLERPADRNASREREHFECVVANEALGFCVCKWDDVETAGGQTGFLDDFS